MELLLPGSSHIFSHPEDQTFSSSRPFLQETWILCCRKSLRGGSGTQAEALLPPSVGVTNSNSQELKNSFIVKSKQMCGVFGCSGQFDGVCGGGGASAADR